MTKTQRLLAAVALAGAAAGLAAPAASAADLPLSPLTLPELPSAAPGMPEGAVPHSVPEIGAKLNDGLNQMGQLMTLPDRLQPVVDPVAPVLGLAGAIQ
ncbi:hypothetical protein [Streptomyces sp. WAC06614]|uniref:hypothetical protein n=1 Tax=Streptomyces sp. WAC06614 TaxID=2487416 RepID=UPI000F7A8C6F|nr:hypothetical protein [Streptomyces sp. WAC06614]RSS81329.1 hypothetical protein EF918_10695 [Streptomyces sp. WAC06614]